MNLKPLLLPLALSGCDVTALPPGAPDMAQIYDLKKEVRDQLMCNEKLMYTSGDPPAYNNHNIPQVFVSMYDLTASVRFSVDEAMGGQLFSDLMRDGTGWTQIEISWDGTNDDSNGKKYPVHNGKYDIVITAEKKDESCSQVDTYPMTLVQ